jgi:hypothetical protein
MLTSPEPELTLLPLLMTTTPPSEDCRLEPLVRDSNPGAPSLEPTAMLRAPLLPDVAEPDWIDNQPLDPADDEPDETNTVPDSPDDNTLLVVMCTCPDPLLTLDPPWIRTLPPSPSALLPAENNNSAPTPEPDNPATTETAPAEPSLAAPVSSNKCPLAPELEAVPVTKIMDPESPPKELPGEVVSDREPEPPLALPPD